MWSPIALHVAQWLSHLLAQPCDWPKKAKQARSSIITDWKSDRVEDMGESTTNHPSHLYLVDNVGSYAPSCTTLSCFSLCHQQHFNLSQVSLRNSIRNTHKNTANFVFFPEQLQRKVHLKLPLHSASSTVDFRSSASNMEQLLVHQLQLTRYPLLSWSFEVFTEHWRGKEWSEFFRVLSAHLHGSTCNWHFERWEVFMRLR